MSGELLLPLFILKEAKMAKKNKNMKKIFVPKGGRGERNFIIVAINGVKYQIMKGVEVEVPLEVAEVYETSLKMTQAADAYEEANSDIM